MMDRRNALLTFSVVMAPVPARGQLTPLRKVAVISPSLESAEEIRRYVLPDLARLGFSEGRNLAVSTHVGPLEDLPRLGREALGTNPDVVIASTNAAVRAILDLSKTTPIVMAFAGEDPVAAGLAKSLAHPGGSVTGLTNLATQLDGKRIAQLHEVVPKARRIGVIAIPPPRHADSLAEMRRIGTLLGFELDHIYAHAPADYPAAFAAMRATGVEAVAVAAAPEYIRDAKHIAALALQSRLPTIGSAVSMARDGFLIGYGPNRIAFRRRAAVFVASILNGTPPGELAIEQPTLFEYAINLKTAKAIGLAVPLLVIAQADEVIE